MLKSVLNTIKRESYINIYIHVNIYKYLCIYVFMYILWLMIPFLTTNNNTIDF